MMDIRTLLVCNAALLTLYAVALLVVGRRDRGAEGLGRLGGACGLVAVGVAFGALRDVVPFPWSIVAGNTFVIAGYLLLRRAVAEMLGEPVPRTTLRAEIALLAAAVAALLYWTYLAPSTAARIAAMSVASALPVAHGALRMLRARPEPDTRAVERSLAAVLGGLAALNVARAAYTLWRGAGEDPMRGGPFEEAFLLAFLLLASAVVLVFLRTTGSRRHAVLHREAHLDPLTGLLNVRGFRARSEVRIAQAARDGSAVLLLFADVDDLKKINDGDGHEAGDRALRDAAAILGDVLRASDCVARLGGDEFCALVPVRRPDDGEIVLGRLRERLRVHNAAPGRGGAPIDLTAAVVPFDPADGRSLDEILREADLRMYAAKRERKAHGPEPGPTS